jgi:hypothetical protein
MMKATDLTNTKPTLHLTAKVTISGGYPAKNEFFDSPFATDDSALATLRERLANRELRTDHAARRLVAMLDARPGAKLADIWRIHLHRYAAGH